MRERKGRVVYGLLSPSMTIVADKSTYNIMQSGVRDPTTCEADPLINPLKGAKDSLSVNIWGTIMGKNLKIILIRPVSSLIT